jgi:hypothetical protein
MGVVFLCHDKYILIHKKTKQAIMAIPPTNKIGKTMEAKPIVYTREEFCKAHKLTRQNFWRIQKEGRGPKFYKVGRRIFIPIEAANEWRSGLERIAGVSNGN